ncbi:MAG TPA: Crp/Fnr family transcriptional regulator [Algoriphagus sp.]|jgi:CRP-like cAMP-binding protein|nr:MULTISPECIES: Crp/Fnr family transcriptional regulator [Algoriphagus]MAL13616.1 Crp/Fnr family transcriptional regulator [Algoriphagus sp.]MAL15395.1 Crp/Fnr family transcriptional regulator [Algoriphagus sp.]QYH38281.1 Crp/Fnr family transcriptional regulator [Algoriphagus sp. NBT04N3]HAH38285.1 Crp/Fnr family transcriptional regulator [Algoriphagus sp.]HAS60754.1 Crp/Fnr family transcriptional regulator [Algoriphagus sp.]|tara:strand:- start:2319 stop:3032 length:714 start_codon:yes stop_codon:yes gene_type:complete
MSNQPHNTPCELCASRKYSLMSDLSHAQVCSISDHKNLISHRKGQILYYEGTKPLGIFCINSGVVKVYKTASNGKEQIVHLGKEGDFLGYAALLGEENYTNSAMIVEDAKICFIPKEAFLNTLLGNTQFFKRVTKELSHELGVMEEKLTDATQKSIRERLAFVLIHLASSYGIEGGDSQKIDLILTREEIAGIVGTATESVIRLLSEFKKDGLIEFEGKKIIIKDKRGLARLSDFYA